VPDFVDSWKVQSIPGLQNTVIWLVNCI
jgi:hypothetical protein